MNSGEVIGQKTLDIVFVAHFAGSLTHGMVYGHYFLAREWVKKGHRVTIIAASWVHTRTRQPHAQSRITEEQLDGIRYVWIRVPRYSPKGRIGRVINLLAFVVQLALGGIPVAKADVVICSSHCPFAIHPSRAIASRFKAMLIFEVRDLWPITLVELGGISKNNLIIAAMQFSENYAYSKADAVVSVLASSKEYMMEHGMAPEKFHYIPNGVHCRTETASDQLPASYTEKLNELKKQGYFIIGYAGRIGLANALDSLIDALTLLSDIPVHCAFLGDGAFLENLRRQTVSLHLHNKVSFFPPVPKSQVNNFLNIIDVAYIGLQKQALFRYGVSPTKLNDYMLAKKPILHAIECPENIVELSGCGYSCDAQNPLEIANGIRQLFSLGNEELARMGLRGYQWIRHNRDYSVLAQKFLNIVLA